MSDCPNVIQAMWDFLDAKLAGGRAERTLERYRDVLAAFCTLVGGKNLLEIKPTHVRRFLAAYRARGCTPETLLSHYNVLVTFFNWTQREYQTTYNPMGAVDRPLVPSPLPESLSKEQIAALLDSAKSTRSPKRNEALLMVMLDTGVRVGELCGLQLTDIDLEKLTIRVMGKDKVGRILPISQETGKALEAYFSIRKDGLPCAFVGGRKNDPKPMAVRVVQSLFKRLSKKLGFHVHPHLLRSTFGSWWIINNGDEESLRRMLGHRTYAMTKRYVRLRTKDLRAKHSKFSPLTLLGGKDGK